MIEVHCAACSDQGKHRGSHSLVAKLDISKLDVPVSGKMFDSPAPERHLEAWGDVPWKEMKCPRGNHLIWKAPYDENQLIIITSKGEIDCAKYRCPYCGKEFKTKRQRHAHSLIHKEPK